MKISLSPQRRDDRLKVIRSGTDVLLINDEVFDFTNLPDGGTIPAGSVPCEWIVGPVERIGGQLHLMLILPHGPNPSQAVTLPDAIIDPPIGWEVSFPNDPTPAIEDVIEEELANVDG
ncbi:hypothetical protein C6558_36060 [Ensifer sp. NM-2]|uniref:hypothetical protein n=1 Tax=Ensifer sp. NM-2 TaxID=2109730 RepID=UPI000D11958D|nr:hypothetical protein [Ensifer sp. NM-2]PSS59841.1 hypothetical protein C6558_36060 [Ensifer sp. NM-2]